MADEKSEKAPSSVMENKEESTKELMQPMQAPAAPMGGKPGMIAPITQGARGRGAGTQCFGDCIVKPMKKKVKLQIQQNQLGLWKSWHHFYC